MNLFCQIIFFETLPITPNPPALQVVMNSILMALIPLMNVAVLILFFIIFCAIMGMELFRGQFNLACADMHTGKWGQGPGEVQPGLRLHAYR